MPRGPAPAYVKQWKSVCASASCCRVKQTGFGARSTRVRFIGCPSISFSACASYRYLMGARDPKHLGEPLATLGDSLALCRMSVSASGLVGRPFAVGAHQKE